MKISYKSTDCDHMMWEAWRLVTIFNLYVQQPVIKPVALNGEKLLKCVVVGLNFDRSLLIKVLESRLLQRTSLLS